MSLLPVEEALARILARVPEVVGEIVPLETANGRVLAAPLVAAHDQPPFNASAMDGYAVRSSDIVDGHRLTVIGTSQAGARYDGTLGPHECVRIFTGAPVPDGADAVIMQEEAHVDGNRVSFDNQPKIGRSIRRAGNDFHVGQTLLAPGTKLTPFGLTVATAANAATLMVSRRPTIGMLATGDELVRPGTVLGPDAIVASNSFGLTPLLEPYADKIIDFCIVGDDRTALKGRLETAFDSGIDILVTTGGASVGDHDIVQDVLASVGVSLDFWRINMRPGKPLMFGVHGKTLVFGLPGNPVSAMVTASVFIKPALRRWLGAPDANAWRLPLAGPTPPNTSRRHFMRARFIFHDGRTAIMPIYETDSGHTLSMSAAEVLIVQPENDPGQPEGTIVEALSLDAF